MTDANVPRTSLTSDFRVGDELTHADNHTKKMPTIPTKTAPQWCIDAKENQAVDLNPLVPKIFPWLQINGSAILAELRKAGWITLSDYEADVLTLNLINHVIHALNAGWGGRKIMPAILSPDEAKGFEPFVLTNPERATVKRDLALMKKADRRRRINGVVEIIAARLAYFQDIQFRLLQPPFSTQAIILREPYGASRFLAQLFQAWLDTTPAEKFFLIGGGEALCSVQSEKKQTIPLRQAIFEVVVCGSLALAPNIPVAKNQVRTARKNLKAIPTMNLLGLRTKVSKGKIPFLVSGLAPKVSLQGRCHRRKKTGGEVSLNQGV